MASNSPPPGSNPSRAKEEDTLVLRLYVAGSTPRSTRAVTNIRTICERDLAGKYELEVIDIYQEPAAASKEQVLAVPTLMRVLPLPLQKFIGDLSDREKVLVGLQVRKRKNP